MTASRTGRLSRRREARRARRAMRGDTPEKLAARAPEPEVVQIWICAGGVERGSRLERK